MHRLLILYLTLFLLFSPGGRGVYAVGTETAPEEEEISLEEIPENEAEKNKEATSGVAMPPKEKKIPKRDSKLSLARRYSADIGGIRAYMDDLQSIDPTNHKILVGDFDALYYRDIYARWGGLAVLGIGAALFLGGFSFLSSAGPVDPLTNQATSRTNMPIVGVGIGLVAAGLVSVMFVVPTREDLKIFVDKHNRYRPKYPLRIEVEKNDGDSFNFNPDLFVPEHVREERKKQEQEKLKNSKTPTDSKQVQPQSGSETDTDAKQQTVPGTSP